MKLLDEMLLHAWKCFIGIFILAAPFVASASDALPDLIARIKPSVMAVGFYQETQNPRFGFRGTGFVVAGGNLLVTNAHVIERSDDASRESILVVHSKGDSAQAGIRRAAVVHLDKAHDLALLRFDGSPLPALELGKPAGAREGQLVAFMGFPLGSALDLGAVAKGWLADRLAQIVHASTGADCVANMGGDLRVISPGEPWVVAADAGREETHMELDDAGLATSGIGHRAWEGGHHIIDPRTGRPAKTAWDSVSVLAGTAAGANTASTACIVIGDQGPRWLADKGLDGWFVGPTGERLVGRWQQLRHVDAARA